MSKPILLRLLIFPIAALALVGCETEADREEREAKARLDAVTLEFVENLYLSMAIRCEGTDDAAFRETNARFEEISHRFDEHGGDQKLMAETLVAFTNALFYKKSWREIQPWTDKLLKPVDRKPECTNSLMLLRDAGSPPANLDDIKARIDQWSEDVPEGCRPIPDLDVQRRLLACDLGIAESPQG